MKRLLAVFLLAFAPALALAADYYVAKDGKDGNPGTLAQPWLTVKKAATSIKAGDTAYVRAGTYMEYFSIANSGTAGAWVTLRNYPGEKPVINGSGLASDWSGAISISGKSYIILDGLTVTGTTMGMGIYVEGPGTDITIMNCDVFGCVGYGGIFVSSKYTGELLTRVIIRNNKVHDLNTTHFEAIRINKNVTYFKIADNEVFNFSNIGIDCCGWVANPDGIPRYGLIDNNYVHDGYASATSGANGIYIDGGRDIVIQNNRAAACVVGITAGAEFAGNTTTGIIIRRNVIYSCKAKGLGFGGSSATNGRVQKISIYNNTLYGNSITAWAPEIKSGQILGGNLIQNNIVFDEYIYQRYHYYCSVGLMKTNTSANWNCYYPNGPRFSDSGGNKYSLTDWVNYVYPNEKNSLAKNPLFIDGPGRVFLLKPGSPCIDAGGPLAVATDTGSGYILRVDNAHPYTDGYDGLFAGDTITVAGQTARVTDIDYDAHILFLDKSVEWKLGEAVTLPFSGSAPDIGALEYQEEKPTVTPTPTPTYTLTPSVTLTATATATPTKPPTPLPVATIKATPAGTPHIDLGTKDETYTDYKEIPSEKKYIDTEKDRYIHLKIDTLDEGACYLPGIYVHGEDGIKRFWPLTKNGEVSTKTGDQIFDLLEIFPKGLQAEVEIVICLGHVYPPPKAAYNKRAVIETFKLYEKAQ